MTDELTRQLATERERANYAWRNTRTIETARQEEMRKRDAAEAEAGRLRGLLIECRGSVKTDLNAYERLLMVKQKHGEQETPTYIAAEAEAKRLFALLEEIDALALATPNDQASGARSVPLNAPVGREE